MDEVTETQGSGCAIDDVPNAGVKELAVSLFSAIFSGDEANPLTVMLCSNDYRLLMAPTSLCFFNPNLAIYSQQQVFSTPQDARVRESRVNLQAACFDYLSLGGCYAAGPVGLLSGLTPVPWVLTTHFFMVAAHGAKTHLWPLPTPAGCLRMYRLLHVATKIIMPLLQEEGSTVLAWWPVRKLVQLVLPWEHELWTK